MGGHTDLPSLSRLFRLSTEQASRDLSLQESQRAISRRGQIDEALAGVNLDDRGAVTSALQGVAPQRAAKFAQETRGQPQEDLEFGVFIAGKLASVLDQVEDQSDYDAAKKFAAEVGIPQDAIDDLPAKFDKDAVAQAASTLRALSVEDLEKETEKFGKPRALPGARPGAGLFQTVSPSGQERQVKGTGVTAARPKGQFGPLKPAPKLGKGVFTQENLTTGEIKVVFKPTGKRGDKDARGLTTAEARLLRSITGDAFGGLYDPRTDTFSFRSKDQQRIVLNVLTEAMDIFAANPKINPAKAVRQAAEMAGVPIPDAFVRDEQGRLAPPGRQPRRRRIERPGGALTDVKQ